MSVAQSPTTDLAFSCLVYRTRNIGDMIQTLALTRLLPPMTGVFRHDLASAPDHQVFVVNGFLERDRTPDHGARCLFAGASGPYEKKSEYLRWIQKSPWPFGARDPVTATRLTAAGLHTEMIGCATLTLPRYDGPRSGIFSVDYPGPGIPISHAVPRTLPVGDQWRLASELLSKYRTAEAVYTSRLHVALPCLAFGTPVYVARPHPKMLPERFSLLEALDVPFERLTVRDTTVIASRYSQFLGRHLGFRTHLGAPKQPFLATTDSLTGRQRIRFLDDDLRLKLRKLWWNVKSVAFKTPRWP